MNELSLKEMNTKRVVYFYKPNGEGNPGEIVYDVAQKNTTIALKASGDEIGRYAYKAQKRVQEYIEQKMFPKRDIQAWY